MSQETLPHWDLSVIYPGLDSPEFAAGGRQVVTLIDELEALFGQHGIAARELQPLSQADVSAFEAIVQAMNRTLERALTHRAYIYSFIATESQNTLAQAEQSKLQKELVRISLLSTRFAAWIGGVDVEALIAASPLAAEHAFMLHKTKQRSAHLMSPSEESLAAELGLTGASAWSRFYSNFTSQLLVPIELEGKSQTLPMTAIRNLAFEADPELRHEGYEAELAAWQRAALPIASALNSIKGEVLTLSKRRGWESPLDVALFDNNIDRETLDAMLTAARESFPDFRRYLRAKARTLGGSRLPWYDLFAPVGRSTREWSFSEGSQFIIEQFGSFSPKLAGLAERAFQERWIDAEPRPGKVGGAFCMPLRGGESRILANYKPAFSPVSTLAHELGHAYHNLNLAERTEMQRSTPMTLAETASIFCEHLVTQAALREATPEEQITILEASLQDACQVVVDITSRFIFESHLFEGRDDRELSADELCTLMREAQLETYGDGLDSELLHPYMWAVKPHYYGSSFYNFPHMFGLLFGLGLYAQYQSEPERFKASYDDLLSSTGLANAAELCARFGIDIHSVDFWRSSLDVIRADIDRFEALVGA